MPVAIRETDVYQVLREWVGGSLTDTTELVSQVYEAMRSHSLLREDFTQLSSRVQKVLFNALYSICGKQMIVLRDDGRAIRIRLEDIPVMADDLLLIVFDALPVDENQFGKLQDYAYGSGSPSAMLVLCKKFQGWFAPAEAELLERSVRENVPEYKWRMWLT